MKKRKFLLSILAATLVTMTAATTVYADDGAWERGYTYNYDYWKQIQYCPDAYEVAGVYSSQDFGMIDEFKNPQSIFVKGNRLYICDTGNNRVLEFERKETDEFEMLRSIEIVKGNTDHKILKEPSDIYVTDDDTIYICDKGNNRVVKMDYEQNFIQEFTKPTDATFDQSISFLPNKLVVDKAGRVYCIADNVNKGIVKYEADGTFTGFYGATKVTYDWADYIWKKLSTAEQRAKTEAFVPTEYDNIYMDKEGFIFACTTNVTSANVRSGEAEPVRRLNLLGSDILIENGNFLVIGDIYWDKGGSKEGCSLINDVTALDNGIYFGLDKVRGRIFSYDTQGNLLFVFGGITNAKGCFNTPVALDHMGRDLLVLDQKNLNITLFTPTEFGELIFKAIDEYDAGDYETSGASWTKVMEMDGNYDLAYIGRGRALMRDGDYKEAMKYFRLKWDTDNYSKAFKQYRKQWVEKNIIWIVLILLVLIVVPLIKGRIRKVKFQIDTSEYLNRNR